MFNFEVSLWKVWNPKLWMSSFECLTLNAQFGGLTWSVGFTVREVPQKFAKTRQTIRHLITHLLKREVWLELFGKNFWEELSAKM